MNQSIANNKFSLKHITINKKKKTGRSFYIEPALFKKVVKNIKTKSKKPIKTWSRSSTVIPEMIGMTICVHRGNKFVPIFIRDDMVGFKLGEFVLTRYFTEHSGDRKS